MVHGKQLGIPNLIHDQQYEIVVRSYDGEDFSPEVRIRITIDNPSDSQNNAPTFNATAWPTTIPIFCDAGSTSSNKCSGGGSIDLAAFFADLDQDSTNLIYDVYNDPTNPDDDYYYGYITLTANGVATYDPVDNNGVMFEARDESKQYRSCV